MCSCWNRTTVTGLLKVDGVIRFDFLSVGSFVCETD